MAATELKWFQFRSRLIDWRNKRRGGRLAILERADERSITMLQKRYGYTREQAASEVRKHYSKAWLGEYDQ